MSKAKQTPENKKHWKCCFRPQKTFAVKFTARTQAVFAASPRHFLSSSPDTSGRAGVSGGPERAHATQESAEGLGKAPGAAWPVSIHVALCWRCWGEFPGVLAKGKGPGATGSGMEKRGWALAAARAAAPKRQQQRYRRVILTAVLTKVDQLLPAQSWLLALPLMSVQSGRATKTQRHRADRTTERVPPVLGWETRALHL